MSKQIIKLPPSPVVGTSHLKVPDRKRAEMFPRLGRDGTNLNLLYSVKIGFDPTHNLEHKEIVDLLLKAEGEAREGLPPIPFSILKPKNVKVKEGDQEVWGVSDTEVTVEVKYREPVTVFEGDLQVTGDRLILDAGTMVEIEVEVKPYSFQTEDGTELAGITLVPRAVHVLSRPVRKSGFKQRKKV